MSSLQRLTAASAALALALAQRTDENVTAQWSAVSSGVYVYNAPQRFTLYLAADL